MAKWIRRVLFVAALVALVVVARETVFADKPVAVRTVAAEIGRVESTITNSRAGTVRARRRSQLSPETSGRVIALNFSEGDTVEEGAIILRLDDTSQRARLKLARSTLAVAQARYDETCVGTRRAKREYERYKDLEGGLISTDRLDQLESVQEGAEARCSSSLALVEQAQAEIALVETEVEKTSIRAPFAGILAQVSVEVGEFITPSPPGVPLPSVIDLIDPASIYVSAPMDEVDSSVIEVGLPVRVTLDPYLGQSFEGTLVRIAPYVLDVEAQNRTVEIEVELAARVFSKGLLPGTTADVEVILDVHEDVLRIPISTLLEGGRVLVLEDGFLVERTLEVGLKNWDWAEITAGLEEGEGVVSSLGSVDVKAGASAVLEDTAPEG